MCYFAQSLSLVLEYKLFIPFCCLSFIFELPFYDINALINFCTLEYLWGIFIFIEMFSLRSSSPLPFIYVFLSLFLVLCGMCLVASLSYLLAYA